MSSSLLIHNIDINGTGTRSRQRKLQQPSSGHAKGLAAATVTMMSI
jgi:hypothetical protein